jgi:hypothetical protein
MEMVKQDNRRELSAKVTTKDGFHLLLFVEFVVILHVESEVCKNIITSSRCQCLLECSSCSINCY